MRSDDKDRKEAKRECEDSRLHKWDETLTENRRSKLRHYKDTKKSLIDARIRLRLFGERGKDLNFEDAGPLFSGDEEAVFLGVVGDAVEDGFGAGL